MALLDLKAYERALTGGHLEKIKGIDNMGLLPIFCQTRDKANSEGGYHAAHPHAL